MLSSAIPTKFQIPFANSAGAGFITTPIPTPPQSDGRASLTSGFSELNFDPLAAGGIPPWGKDFNGLLNQITDWLRLVAAGGAPVMYDPIFQAAISGYPRYALVKVAAGDRFWLSTVENNVTNPDTGGAGWALFPDVIVQSQAGNWVNETGGPNNYLITLSPLPATISALFGAPIRAFVGSGSGTNTVAVPHIRIVTVAGTVSLPMVNANGSPLAINQIGAAGTFFEGFTNGALFFITAPSQFTNVTNVSGSPAITGVIYEWGAEVPPSWGLECNGQEFLISSFPNLFNVIGWRFGGNNSSTFRVPDKRGAFTRGWDHGRGLDPGASVRISPNAWAGYGGNGPGGDHVGTYQASAADVASGLVGTRMILTGDPNLGPGSPPGFPIYEPLNDSWTGVNPAYFIRTRTGGQFALGVPGQPPINFTWGTLAGIASSSFLDAGGSGSPVLSADPVVELGVMVATAIGPTHETRPVNIDMMYVIAF